MATANQKGSPQKDARKRRYIPLTWPLAKEHILGPKCWAPPAHKFNCPVCEVPMMCMPNPRRREDKDKLPYILPCGDMACVGCLSRHFKCEKNGPQSSCPVCGVGLSYSACDHVIQPFPIVSFEREFLLSTPPTAGETTAGKRLGLSDIPIPAKCHACSWGPVCRSIADWIELISPQPAMMRGKIGGAEVGSGKMAFEQKGGSRPLIDSDAGIVIYMAQQALGRIGGRDLKGTWDWSGSWILAHSRQSFALPLSRKYMTLEHFEREFGPVLPFWYKTAADWYEAAEKWLHECRTLRIAYANDGSDAPYGGDGSGSGCYTGEQLDSATRPRRKSSRKYGVPEEAEFEGPHTRRRTVFETIANADSVAGLAEIIRTGGNMFV